VSTGGDSCSGRRRPHGPYLFFESDGGLAAEVSDLSEMMAAMPPRPKASFTYAFLICIFSYCRNLDRVRISGYLPV
jgi:hypothetical protein